MIKSIKRMTREWFVGIAIAVLHCAAKNGFEAMGARGVQLRLKDNSCTSAVFNSKKEIIMGERTRKLPLRIIAVIAVTIAVCFAVVFFSHTLSFGVNAECAGTSSVSVVSVCDAAESDGTMRQNGAYCVDLLAANTATDEINANLETIYKLLFLLFACDAVIAIIVIVAVVMSVFGKNDSDKKNKKEKSEREAGETNDDETTDEKSELSDEKFDIVAEKSVSDAIEPTVETAETPKSEFESSKTAMAAALGEFDTEEEPLPCDEEDDLASTEFVADGDAFASMRKRSTKTFADRLAEADEQTKANYETIKNELLSYKKMKSRMSRKCESYRVGRVLLAKIMFSGKSIKCYFALDPAAYETSVFHHRDVSEKKSYVDVPMLVRVRSNRSVKNAKKLVEDMAEKNELIKK